MIDKVMLVDDHFPTVFLHKEIMKESGLFEKIVVFQKANDALKYLDEETEGKYPELIFLDINMPGMDGWEFLTEYSKLQGKFTYKIPVLIMLTNSYNPDDEEKTKKFPFIKRFMNKPLTSEDLKEINEKYF